MTDQPTTWTLERALAMLRDYKTSRIEGEIGRFIETWGNLWPVLPIAIAALESAAAEIERQKARADALERERDGWRREESKCVSMARETLGSDAPAHLSTIADCVVSLGALVERLRAELAAERDRAHRAEQAHAVAESKVDEMLHPAAQQGPSDEEIDSAIDSVRRHRLNSEDAFIETYHALRKIARRAGVKL